MTAHRAFLDAPPPLVFAHRGGARLCPENTLEAFRHAVSLGHRYIETDAHVTRDGAIVLFHDATLDRTTNGSGPLAAHTLAELRRLDAAFAFTQDGTSFPCPGHDVRIPTLEEALAISPAVRLNVELKSLDPRAPRALWELIDGLGAHDRILVAAGRHAIARAFRREARDAVATSASSRETLAFWAASRLGADAARAVGPAYDALQVPLSHRGLFVVDEPFVRAAHACGLSVHVWTVDSPRVAAHLCALGVDGIMTDRPDLFVDPARPGSHDLGP